MGKHKHENEESDKSTSLCKSSSSSSIHKSKKKHRKHNSSSSDCSKSSDESDSSGHNRSSDRSRLKVRRSTSIDRKKLRKDKKRHKKKKKLEKKLKKEKKRLRKMLTDKSPTEPKDPAEKTVVSDSEDITERLLTHRAKAMAPMTKEEWDKRQSVVRRVYDEESGRNRLIKGDGEVIEEIVSRDRHIAINRQATQGDGNYFQASIAAKLRK